MLNFLKQIFGSGETEAAENAPINETSHPNPRFDNQPGHLFKKEYESLKKEAVLLDVRSTLEVSMGALPGAVNIDIMSPSFAKKVAFLDKSKTYFIYCRSGNRSGQACQIMHKMGFDVRNLLGGIGAYPV